MSAPDDLAFMSNNAMPIKIMLVEDDQWMADFVVSLLTKNASYEVIRMPNGLEAFKFLQKTKVDLILTDLLMPEMDGLELIQRRSELPDDVPVIALSGGGYRLDQGELLKYAEIFGAKRVLNKPVNPQHLLDSISSVLGERRA